MTTFEWIHASEKEYHIPENPDTMLFIDLDRFRHYSREAPRLETLLERLDNIPPSERYRVVIVGAMWGWTPSDFRELNVRGVHHFKTALTGSDYVPTVEKLQDYYADVMKRRSTSATTRHSSS